MRRRTIRPSSRYLLMLVTAVVALILWVSWEVGRIHKGRALAAIFSAATFVFFAVGWMTR